MEARNTLSPIKLASSPDRQYESKEALVVDKDDIKQAMSLPPIMRIPREVVSNFYSYKILRFFHFSARCHLYIAYM